MRDEAKSDADRFLELLRPLERDLELYCRRLIWETQDVSDAIQNAVLRAFAAFDRYHEDASFRAWMFKILTNEVLTLNRKHSRIAQHEFQLDPVDLEALSVTDPTSAHDGSIPSLEQLSESLDQELAAALKILTETERAVLLLRAMGGFRYREISDALDMPLGSVMGLLARARTKLRAAILRAKSKTTLNGET